MKQYFRQMDACYDDAIAMPGQRFNSPGYHTRVESGAWVHPTVIGAEYAVLLLRSREAAQIERAGAILKSLLALQETDPTRPAYGVWPYLHEEPIEQMALPDWNWACFIGTRLAEILLESPDLLEPALLEDVRAAVGRAAWCEFRPSIPKHATGRKWRSQKSRFFMCRQSAMERAALRY